MIKQFYRPTEKISIPSLMLVPFVVIPLWVISFLYAGILIWNPFHFLNIGVFVVFGFGIAQLIELLINVSKIRNVGLARALVWIISLLFIYFSWANFFTISSANAWPLTMLEPHIWWQTMIEFYSSGAHSTFGIEINGFFGAIVWILEAIILIWFSLLIGVAAVKDDVYCETCQHWLTSIQDFYTFSFEDHDELLKLFQNQDVSLFDKVDASEDLTNRYAVDIAQCNTCSNTRFMTLRQVMKEGKKVDEKLLTNLKAKTEMYEKLNVESQHWVQYSESGKYSLDVWLGILLLSPLIFGLFWLYQHFCLFLENAFFSGMAFFLVAGVLHWLVVKSLQIFEVRNNVISSYYGLVVAGISVYLLELALFSAASKGDFFSYNPNDIWIILHAYIESHEDFEWYKWTGLMIEACLVFIIPVAGGSTLSTSYIYCEKCKAWATEQVDLLVFDFEDQKSLVNQFTRQNMIFLKDIQPVNIASDKITYYRINAHHCNTCENLYTMTLESIIRTRTADGYKHSFSTLIENMVVTKSTFDIVTVKSNEVKNEK